MKRFMLLFGILFVANYAFAQRLVLPSSYAPSYRSGKLIGIGEYSNDNVLGIMEISFRDLSNMLEDYKSHFTSYSYGSSGFQSIFDKVSELEKDKNNKSREIEDLRNTIKQQERTIEELKRSTKEKDDALEKLSRRIDNIERKL